MSNPNELLTFGGHLEVFRRMLFRVIGVDGTIAVAIFCLKDWTFELLLAPSEWNFVTSDMLAQYRKHAFLIIMFVAAVITPPDLMTLVLVTLPLYLLYEVSIRVVKYIK